jgi:hypothetical protein
MTSNSRFSSFLAFLPPFAFAAVVGCSGGSGPVDQDGRIDDAESDLSKGKGGGKSKDGGAADVVACPPIAPPVCPPGQKVADVNGDGCALECEIIACPPIAPPVCPPGQKVADVNGDGCALECEIIACPPFFPSCGPGEKVADVDGDGCALECAPE